MNACDSIGMEKINEIISEIKNKEHYVHKYEIIFHNSVSLPVNRYKNKEFDKIKVKLFISTNGDLCYTFHKRTGFRFLTYIEITNIEEINRIFYEDEVESRMHKAELLRKKIHKNLWPELRNKTAKELKEKDFRESNLNPVYFIKKFSRWSRDRIAKEVEEAIEQKKNYNYRQTTSSPTGRDLSIEVRVCEDGVMRGWFSSEYMGCANGDYYLILNPKVAVFCERD